ncbi:hypothetical protein BCR33DRAFT_721660 [Rhizoclosmatium globosum]|uniref:G8 domain-containing protein n=1 Tax=Rhizoclosmatium globosum TaxID=329046 RepID=A0A1Y2BQV5_9FUNG|nr:hypothetical protein BCR33DRAFT_721660 [Rhizoclosmatium globosum]|eukprot:ORY37007.1 hypothetical protein BCR33DRAFT_721660 [Rhizoclosmatium globosum]
MYYVFVISIAATSAFSAPSSSQSGDSVSGYHQSSIAPLFKTTQAIQKSIPNILETQPKIMVRSCDVSSPDTSNRSDECPHRLLNLKRWESNDTWPNGVVPLADVDGGGIWMVLHGKKPVGVSLNNVPEPSLKGKIVRGPDRCHNGGTLDVHGMVYAPAWTRLAATSRKGDKQILIQDIVNWEVGQTIIITTTATKDSRDFNQNDIAVIEDIKAAQNIGATTSLVTIKEPLLYDHYGGSEYQAEVGLLSRRIVVKGDSKYSNRTTAPAVCVGDDVSDVSTWPCGAPHGYGGHIIIVGTAIGRVSGVELIRMGQTNVMGRYPFHIHQAAENGINSYLSPAPSIKASSVAVKQRRYDITGNCFYIEDGIEEDNVFAFNLASHIHFLGDQDPVNLIAPTDITAAGFYITNPHNSFIGNAASGGWTGFSFPGLPAPMHRVWWSNGAGIYVVTAGSADTCWSPLQNFGCPIPSRAWMRFSNTKVFLSNKGIMHWGQRSEVVKYEGHDLGVSASVFGQVWIDQMLWCSSANSKADDCAERDMRFWTDMLGFQWYDQGQNHILSNITFRGCNNDWQDAYDSSTMAVWQFLTHSDQFVPGVMQTTRDIVYQNCKPDDFFMFGHYERYTVSGRLQSWVDYDGTATLSQGRTLMGSSWADLWLCTNDNYFEASFYLTSDASQLPLIGNSICSNGDLSIDCPNGYAFTANTIITGPAVANGVGWFVQYDRGAPISLVISKTQFPDPSNYITLVTPYPPGTTFTITAKAADYCYTINGYRQTWSLTDFQNEANGLGDVYYFDNVNGLLYLNICDAYCYSIDGVYCPLSYDHIVTPNKWY